MKTNSNSTNNITYFASTLLFFVIITATLTGCQKTPPTAAFTAENTADLTRAESLHSVYAPVYNKEGKVVDYLRMLPSKDGYLREDVWNEIYDDEKAASGPTRLVKRGEKYAFAADSETLSAERYQKNQATTPRSFLGPRYPDDKSDWVKAEVLTDKGWETRYINPLAVPESWKKTVDSPQQVVFLEKKEVDQARQKSGRAASSAGAESALYDSLVTIKGKEYYILETYTTTPDNVGAILKDFYKIHDDGKKAVALVPAEDVERNLPTSSVSDEQVAKIKETSTTYKGETYYQIPIDTAQLVLYSGGEVKKGYSKVIFDGREYQLKSSGGEWIAWDSNKLEHNLEEINTGKGLGTNLSQQALYPVDDSGAASGKVVIAWPVKNFEEYARHSSADQKGVEELRNYKQKKFNGEDCYLVPVDAESLQSVEDSGFFDNAGDNVRVFALDKSGTRVSGTRYIEGGHWFESPAENAVEDVAVMPSELNFLKSTGAGIAKDNLRVYGNNGVWYLDASSIKGAVMQLWRKDQSNSAPLLDYTSQIFAASDYADKLVYNIAEIVIKGLATIGF